MELQFAERSAAYTIRGRRLVNQDAVASAALANGAEMVALADGMGGHNAGEVASAQALEALQSALAGDADLVSAVRTANACVLKAAARPEYRGMGTTLVALMRQDSTYLIANVGDSRAYRVDATGVTQITRDHSFVAEAVGSGEMSLQDAERSRWRNAVTRSLGTDANLAVDCYGPFDTREAHAIVLCTDGVYRVVAEDTMLAMLRRAVDVGEAVRALVHGAFDAGSEDNISAAVVNFGLIRPVEPAPSHSVGRSARKSAGDTSHVPRTRRRDAGRTRGAHEAAADPALERRRLRRQKRARRRTLLEAAFIVAVTIATVVLVALRWLMP